jgi:hypothetical protein
MPPVQLINPKCAGRYRDAPGERPSCRACAMVVCKESKYWCFFTAHTWKEWRDWRCTGAAYTPEYVTVTYVIPA